MLIETSILNATSYVKIKSITDSNLVDGGYYTIIFKKRSTFFDGPNGYPVTRTYRKQTLDDAISTSTILKLVKINENWHLINLEHGKYLCDDPNCSSQNDFGYSSSPNDPVDITKVQPYIPSYEAGVSRTFDIETPEPVVANTNTNEYDYGNTKGYEPPPPPPPPPPPKNDDVWGSSDPYSNSSSFRM